jgi:hypothetical protein
MTHANPLTPDRAYELGYQRGLDDMHNYYREAVALARGALDDMSDEDGGYALTRLERELDKLDISYERARNQFAQLELSSKYNSKETND